MRSERLQILYLIDYFHRTGGTEKHLAQLVAGLPADEIRCTIAGFDLGNNPLLDEVRAAGIEVVHFPVGREYVPSAWRQAIRLWRFLRRSRFDIVQTYHQKADSFGALVARAAGAPHLISSKRDTGELRNPLHVFVNRRLRGLFQAFIMASEGVRRAVSARDGLPQDKIVTIYNGVDADRFRVPSSDERLAARARLGFEDGDFVIGMVAGFRPEKSHDRFFEAMSLLADRVPRLKLLLVGGGPLLASHQRGIAGSQLAPLTTFTGDVTEVVPCLWAMDVGCLIPTSNEGFSNAVIEQMACGLPLIVSNVGGNAEAVANGENGYVVEPGNAQPVMEAALRLYAEPALRLQMGLASRQRAERSFSLARMCDEHLRLYKSLIASNRPS
ncbi:MAG: glycosyltransferase [Proteobacteria bacterium]|nr:glycosyltransferase [Pseudomonadota bacterium]